MRAWICVAAVALVMGGAAQGVGPSTSPAQEAKIQKLREQALSAGNYPTTRAALMELRAMGQAAHGAILEVTKELLDRDAAVIEKAVKEIDPQGMQAADAMLTGVRPLALANVEIFGPEGTRAKAHEYYEQLVPAQEKVNAALMSSDAVQQITSRRVQLLDLYRQHASREETQSLSADEAKLRAAVQKVMSSLPAVPASADLNRPPRANDPRHRVWHYRICRQIEAYNEAMAAAICNAVEVENLRIMNAYREALGLIPLELDPRLVQAARKHSKEMVDKSYYSH